MKLLNKLHIAVNKIKTDENGPSEGVSDDKSDIPQVLLGESIQSAFRNYKGEYKLYIRDPEHRVEIVKNFKDDVLNFVKSLYAGKLESIVGVPEIKKTATQSYGIKTHQTL